MTTPATSPTPELDERTLVYLSELARFYPSISSALTKLSTWEAELTLPKGSIHVISDIHGDYRKLRHVINNASGHIRPLVDQLFSEALNETERRSLLNLIYYPSESAHRAFSQMKAPEQRAAFVRTAVQRQWMIIRTLARRYPLDHVESVFPRELSPLFRELLIAPQLERSQSYTETLIAEFIAAGREVDLLRSLSRVIRNLSIAEIIIAGDFGDRGPRIDRVLDYVMRQPRVSITWGNHDTSWMGACLGSLVCIATVVRISLRYQRLIQLEEGYGIPLTPLEDLANDVYGTDPAACFMSKGSGGRDALLLARMQKAMAVIQLKLEGQVSARNPHFNLAERNFLHRCDFSQGIVERYGKKYPLLDKNFPTISSESPYALSEHERRCMELLRESFLFSPRLWNQMKYVANYGTMYLVRDDNLIFHGCVPVDEQGDFIALEVDGAPRKGRALFEALNIVVQRAFRERTEQDLDLLWYLWSGARSPLFGKDCMATFETYLLADKDTHKEHKNPYFDLIHTPEFCDKVMREFGVDASRGLIVNGHVPVKIEKGESPLKRSGKAVTIDGAFSEAYGDRGFTLVLEAERTCLAQHHHFDSVLDALDRGTDIIPTVQVLREYSPPRLVRDTDRGARVRHHVETMHLLIRAYRENKIRETELR